MANQLRLSHASGIFLLVFAIKNFCFRPVNLRFLEYGKQSDCSKALDMKNASFLKLKMTFLFAISFKHGWIYWFSYVEKKMESLPVNTGSYLYPRGLRGQRPYLTLATPADTLPGATGETGRRLSLAYFIKFYAKYTFKHKISTYTEHFNYFCICFYPVLSTINLRLQKYIEIKISIGTDDSKQVLSNLHTKKRAPPYSTFCLHSWYGAKCSTAG